MVSAAHWFSNYLPLVHLKCFSLAGEALGMCNFLLPWLVIIKTCSIEFKSTKQTEPHNPRTGGLQGCLASLAA